MYSNITGNKYALENYLYIHRYTKITAFMNAVCLQVGMNEEDILGKLELAVNDGDFVWYKDIVDKNFDVFNGISSDYWRETFYQGDHDEVFILDRLPL